jgi:hypothetical protein
MTTRKRLEGALADWHPHPKDNNSLAPVVRDADVPAAAADDLADPFFDSAPALATPEPPIAIAEPAPRLVAIDSAAVRARRRYLMRYVAGAVSVASVIGLAAIVRTTLAGDASAADTPRAASVAASLPAFEPVTAPAQSAAAQTIENAAAQPAETAAAPPAAVAQPADSAAAPPAAAAQPADTAAAQPTPVAAGAPAPSAGEAPAAAPPGESAAAPPPSAQSASEAKKASLKALERGRLAAAIEAGEQSVALDPGDADAWLVLGAAYQQRGRYADARRCFTTCAAQAQRGPRGECRALAR